MTLKHALWIFGLFFVGCFMVGFLEARHDLQSRDHIEMDRGLDYASDAGPLTFSCPGSGVLYRYSVADDKAWPDNPHISKFKEQPQISLKSVHVPEVGTETGAGLIGVLGGRSLVSKFKSGNLQTRELGLVGLGLGSGAFLGYFVGKEVLLPTSCDDGAKFIKKLEDDTDWKHAADTYFGNRFDDLNATCQLAEWNNSWDCSPQSPRPWRPRNEQASVEDLAKETRAYEVLYKVRCNGHMTADDFRWLLETKKQCAERRGAGQQIRSTPSVLAPRPLPIQE